MGGHRRRATAPTRNPWDRDRTPGGSSGGAAAAVAAGLVPIAQCNDGLGSIRIPAACCGLVGLKPGRGVIPAELGIDGWFGLVENGVLTTTVADAALGFSVLAGREPVKLVEPDKLRVGVSMRSPVVGVRPDEPNRGAVATASQAAGAGRPRHRDGRPDLPDVARPARAGHLVRGRLPGGGGAGLRQAAAAHPAAHPARQVGQRGPAWFAQSHRDAWRERSIKFFADHSIDLLLTPALAAAPPPAEQYSSGSWRRNMSVNMRYAPYAAPWNVAGLPAIVVPVGLRPDGLPLAVQLVGPPDSELLLLSVAGQFEVLNPWQRHAFG